MTRLVSGFYFILVRALLLLLLIYLFSGCTFETRYSILTFLFDGVPDTMEVNTEFGDLDQNTNISDSMSLTSNKPVQQLPEIVLHPPYLKKKCNNCHLQSMMGELILPLPELCYTCHLNMKAKNNALHGPVASGNCIECHHPHKSKLDNLLLFQNQELCFKCHDSVAIYRNDFHAFVDDFSSMLCTDCHNPHGGDNRIMPQQGMCYFCHDDFSSTYRYLHGPVAGKNCSACHGTHGSSAKIALLLRNGQNLCLYCHDSNNIFENENHSEIGNTNCTECHNPHGSEDKSMLN